MPISTHRVAGVAAATLAALALAASPALAGEDDTVEPPPPDPTVVVAPTPTPTPAPPAPTPTPAPAPSAAPAPAPAPAAPESSHGGAKANKESGGHRRVVTRVVYRPVTVVRTVTVPTAARTMATTIPQGGVQAGGGGTAPDPEGPAVPLAAGVLLLLAGGGLVARGRRPVA